MAYSRVHLVVVAIWWGLLAGLGEGLIRLYSHPYIWRDMMRAAVIVNPLLFGAIAVLITLKPPTIVTRQLLVRANIGFGFLAAYDVCDQIIPRYIFVLPFLVSLAVASIAGYVVYLYSARAMEIQKRTLLLLTSIAILCVVVFPIQQRRYEARELAQLPSPPSTAHNAVVIVVDTSRADHLSTYGYSRETSPTLTELAKQGVLFSNAISPSSWTLPAHASILTGLYPHDHHTDGDTSNLGSGYRTVAEVIRGRGYRTAAFSANAGTFGRDRGFGRGFIHFEDDFQSWGSTFGRTYYGGKIEGRLCKLHLTRDMLGRPGAAEINERALRWIDSDRRPFFMFLNYYDAHDPYLPPDPYLHTYTKISNPGGWYTEHWEWFERLTPEQRQAAMDAYDGAINYVDAQIAHLIQELNKRKLSENTVVIITSDHGEGFGEHGLMNHGNSLYRELIHVPLIFWEPSQIPAGRVVKDPVSLTALPATVMDLIGDAGQPQFPGRSLREWWVGQGHSTLAAPISELAQLSWNPRYPNYYGPMQSVTTSQWHYISGGNGSDQLFRCCDEPETINLANTAEGQRVCEQFRQDLRAADLETTREEGARQTSMTRKVPARSDRVQKGFTRARSGAAHGG